jgi:hypothetical protein
MSFDRSVASLILCLFILVSCTPGAGTPTAQESAKNTELPALSIAEIQQTALAVSDTPESQEATRTPAPRNNSLIVTNTPLAQAQVAEASDTERPSHTPEPTDTEQPSSTPRPAEVDTDTYYVTGSTANVRSCSTTDCERVTALSYGDDVEVIESVDGASVSGSTQWYRVLLTDGHEGFIHSSLVSRTRPVAGSSNDSGSGSGSSGGSSSGSTGSTNVQPTAVPQQAQPTAAPQVQPTQPPVVGYSCDCNKTCGAMTCDEAYFQLNTCGCGARDNDNDGVPCESVCSGG